MLIAKIHIRHLERKVIASIIVEESVAFNVLKSVVVLSRSRERDEANARGGCFCSRVIRDPLCSVSVNGNRWVSVAIG